MPTHYTQMYQASPQGAVLQPIGMTIDVSQQYFIGTIKYYECKQN